MNEHSTCTHTQTLICSQVRTAAMGTTQLTGQGDRFAVFAPLLHGLRTARLPRVSLLYCRRGNESGTIDIARHQVIHGALLLDGHRGAAAARVARVRRLLSYSFKGTRVGGQRQSLLPTT